MIGYLLKLLFTKGTSIKRWNNFPRVEDVTPLDNAAFVIHISLFMAHLEEKNGKKIDKEYIIKRILFGLFNSLILSDINSGTRDYIMKENSSVMLKLEEKVLDYINSMKGTDFLKKDLREVLSDKSSRIENKIISGAKNFAGLQECNVNAKIFDNAYDVALKEINNNLEKDKIFLFSLNEILNNKDYEKYLSHIRRLSHSMRWSGIQRKYPISVMSHLIIVTFISYCLANIEGKNESEVYEIMLKSVYHDIPEAITGDIITPIKNSITGFRETLEKVEKKMMNDYFFVYVDDEYKKEIGKYMLNPFEGEIGTLAKHADIISALLESEIENKTNNSEFTEIYKKLKVSVNNFNTKSSNYFLKDVLLDFGEDVGELKIKK